MAPRSQNLNTTMHVRVDPDTLAALVASARENERGLSGEARLAIKAWLASRVAAASAPVESS